MAGKLAKKSEVPKLLEKVGTHLRHLHSGKVRESFRLRQKNGRKLRLVIVTDRRSIFDFKLGFEVEKVGMILNATNIYYRSQLDEAGIKHDLVASGTAIDSYLPEELRGDPELWKRAVVVYELDMLPVEIVVRNYLTGTGHGQYKAEDGVVCGQQLPPGLRDGSKLPGLLYTPTTKALVGHDKPLSVDEVDVRYPYLRAKAFELFGLVRADVERLDRFIWVDGKAEGGIDPLTGEFVWGDEIGTPDACRIWRKAEYDKCWPQGKLPSPFDKELVRNWGRAYGIDKFIPENPEHQQYVRGLRPTRDELYRMMLRNFEFFDQTKFLTYEAFQHLRMGIPAKLCG
jgi:phosphoribosylaminoimidazole-succinocarboxamide synthase